MRIPFDHLKFWQIIAIVSGTIITTVMAVASVSYTTTLTTPEPIFPWVPIPNTVLFGAMALAFDLGMIVSIFGTLHWWPRHRLRAWLCGMLFVIASLFSVHAVRGAIALNVLKAEAPAARSTDLYASLKLDLAQAQSHLGNVQAAYTNAGRRERRRLDAQILSARKAVQDARTRLVQADVPARVSPIAGLDWVLAIMLWFFNATCWSAWFGPSAGARDLSDPDSVTAWLATYDWSESQHCAVVFAAYGGWCQASNRTPLAQYSFYARLVELGARKFRDGRNGPTMYAPPGHAS
ncbi:MAG: hypothetical protein AAFY27_07495 [Pseudomonadota bacterium]